MMIHYTTEDELWENCLSTAKLFEYVKSISGEDRWFFKECFKETWGENHTAIFHSWASPEFEKFLLSILIKKTEEGYSFIVMKKVTELS